MILDPLRQLVTPPADAVEVVSNNSWCPIDDPKFEGLAQNLCVTSAKVVDSAPS
tara:strand:+ start:275 stop:436 length:162 start_codon:yes stop_codon:yes gene_type:complete